MTHVKGRNAIYNQYFILRQITPARNLPPDLQKYVFKQNGVKHYMSLYDVNPGEFQVLKAFFLLFFHMAIRVNQMFFIVQQKIESQKCLSALTLKSMCQKLLMGVCVEDLCLCFFTFY